MKLMHCLRLLFCVFMLTFSLAKVAGGGDADGKDERAILMAQAEAGISEAQARLGAAYLSGALGFPEDKQAARYWLRKGAEGGDSGAQLVVAMLLHGGAPQEAAIWYQRAAEQGDAEAQYQLGTLYFKGLGVLKSQKRARRWFHLAASNEHKKAQEILQVLERRRQVLDTMRTETSFPLDDPTDRIEQTLETQGADKRQLLFLVIRGAGLYYSLSDLCGKHPALQVTDSENYRKTAKLLEKWGEIVAESDIKVQISETQSIYRYHLVTYLKMGPKDTISPLISTDLDAFSALIAFVETLDRERD